MRLIGQIQQATQGAARLLCTLARRGKALERDAPERSADLLAAVRTHPFYKGGRLAFDMLEIEDVMLDGLALDPMSTRELIQVLKADVRGLVETLMRMGFRGLRGAGDSLRFDGDVDGAVPDTQPAASSSLPMPRVRLGPPADAPTLAGEAAEERTRARARIAGLRLPLRLCGGGSPRRGRRDGIRGNQPVDALLARPRLRPTRLRRARSQS